MIACDAGERHPELTVSLKRKHTDSCDIHAHFRNFHVTFKSQFHTLIKDIASVAFLCDTAVLGNLSDVDLSVILNLEIRDEGLPENRSQGNTAVEVAEKMVDRFQPQNLQRLEEIHDLKMSV